MFTLSDARWAILNKPEFRCNERDFGFVIDYNVAFADTFKGASDFDTMILQNLRGTCFDKDGKIIRLAYHKFHNAGENEEYAIEKFDFRNAHVIQEKLDGSMVTPLFNSANKRWKFATRAGFTDVSEKADRLFDSWSALELKKWQEYDKFMRVCMANELTPMFEFCSRAQRIVIDYPEPKLVLTGVRENKTGKYLNVQTPPLMDVVQVVSTEASTLAELVEAVKGFIGSEGVVVKFGDGRMVKIKGAEYCLFHKAIDGLRFEKDVLKMILTGKMDDVLPLVTPEMKARLLSYSESVQARLKMATEEMISVFERNKNVPSKKEFAVLVMNSPYKTGLFRLWDGQEYSLADFVVSKCGSSTGVEEVRHLVGKSFLEF